MCSSFNYVSDYVYFWLFFYFCFLRTSDCFSRRVFLFVFMSVSFVVCFGVCFTVYVCFEVCVSDDVFFRYVCFGIGYLFCVLVFFVYVWGVVCVSLFLGVFDLLLRF